MVFDIIARSVSQYSSIPMKVLSLLPSIIIPFNMLGYKFKYFIFNIHHRTGHVVSFLLDRDESPLTNEHRYKCVTAS